MNWSPGSVTRILMVPQWFVSAVLATPAVPWLLVRLARRRRWQARGFPVGAAGPGGAS